MQDGFIDDYGSADFLEERDTDMIEVRSFYQHCLILTLLFYGGVHYVTDLLAIALPMLMLKTIYFQMM